MLFLACWPALTFEWKWSDRFFFKRARNPGPDSDVTDHAALRIGPVVFTKTINPWMVTADRLGFRTQESYGVYTLAYIWSKGIVTAEYDGAP
ncbi:MAG TPA: hypothetical protein VG796_26250 [Verrucomicrobiales bacterium]|jgi:hypothetical protein|nr:hypothetical protein [Verrucomicrobiales bacterium]